MENKIIEIGKELIYLSAKYSNYTQEERQQLLQKLSQYKKELLDSDTKYSKTVTEFVIDLESDLLAGRKLEIDTIKHDEYLENYFESKREINHYNQLIDIEIYNKIFQHIHTDKDLGKIHLLLSKLENEFNNQLTFLSAESVSKNLLIFTLFEKNLVSKALKNLYNFIMMIPKSDREINIIRNMISKHNYLVQQIYNYGIQHYNQKTYNIYYMKFESEIINGEKITNLKKYNSAQLQYRTGNAHIEYKRLLKKIIEL